MPSALRQEKISKQFRLLDTNGKGRISSADHTAVASRFCAAFGIDLDSRLGKDIHARYADLYTQLCGGEGEVTEEQFAEHVTKRLSAADIAAVYRPLVQAVIVARKASGDGELSRAEFRRWLVLWGLSEDDADEAFLHLDLDGSARLSVEEVLEALEEFYGSDDPYARGNWMFGPLEHRSQQARIPYADPAALPVETRQLLQALPQMNMFRMLSHAHTMFGPAVGLAKALFAESELPEELRELVILQTAQTLDGTYVWTQHVKAARAARCPRAKIVAVRDGRLNAPCLSDAEQAALTFVAEVQANNRSSAATLDRLVALLSPRQIVELLMISGFYVMICRVSTALHLDSDRSLGDEVVSTISAL